MSDSAVFSHRTSTGGCYALMVVLLVFPAMGVTSYLADSEGRLWWWGLAAIATLLGAALALSVGVRTDYRVELDAVRARFLEQHRWFGWRRSETVMFESRLDEASRVKVVNTRTPSRHGGWNHSSVIHFPGEKNVVPSDFLGGREDPKSEYHRLVATLRERFGDRFSEEEKV